MAPIRTVLVSLIAVALGACASESAEEESVASQEVPLESASGTAPLPVIADFDMSDDDNFAIAYLCREHKRGRIALKAVTVGNNGVGLPGFAIRHARCALRVCGLENIPIADGANTAPNVFPGYGRDYVNATQEGVYANCDASSAASAVDAADLIVQTVRASSTPVDLLLFGAQTSAAHALAQPGVKDKIKRIHIMGGAFNVAGNLFDVGPDFDYTQEFNIWFDPPSAQQVLDRARYDTPIEYIPLDATNATPITYAYVDYLNTQRKTPEANLVSDINTSPNNYADIAYNFLYWWDGLGAVAAYHPSVVTYSKNNIAVVQTGPSAGRTIFSAGGRRAQVALAGNGPKFETTFDAILNGRPLPR